jgi:TPR repeat protein
MARFYYESHKPPPTLIETMDAADKGDAQAQKTLGDIYANHKDFANCLKWYRKSGEQGNSNAQYCVAKILLKGRGATEFSPEIAADPDEAVVWLGRAANQGCLDAQLDLAVCYQSGTGVDQDQIEAYMWFSVASRRTNSPVKATLESLALKMSRDEIAAAQQRADAFVPGRSSGLPQPAYLGQLELKGISGIGKTRLAIINNQTFGVDETAEIRLRNKTITVHCVGINDRSALVQVGPFYKLLPLHD